MQQKTVFIEAQRLFRKKKHGMDVVALELLLRLRNTQPGYKMKAVVKQDEDQCIHKSQSLSIETLKSAFYPLWEQWVLPFYARKNKASLLHCTGNTAPLWSRTPLIVTIHDLIFLEDNYLLKKDGGSLYQRFGNYYRRLIVPRVARRARHIVTVSEFQRALILQRLKVPAEKVSVVYNGTNDRFFDKATSTRVRSVLANYRINFPYILFFANTEPRKNTTGVIKAFSMFCKKYPHSKLKLVIKGLNEGQLRQKLEECGANAYTDRIHPVGYIEYNDLPILYQGAEVLWFPSFSEGFGLPIVEAMASGTPVITSNVSVMPEIARDAALYVNPTLPAELVQQTHHLLTDPDLKSSLIRKGRERAAGFKWDKSANELLSIYDKVLGEL